MPHDLSSLGLERIEDASCTHIEQTSINAWCRENALKGTLPRHLSCDAIECIQDAIGGSNINKPVGYEGSIVDGKSGSITPYKLASSSIECIEIAIGGAKVNESTSYRWCRGNIVSCWITPEKLPSRGIECTECVTAIIAAYIDNTIGNNRNTHISCIVDRKS